VGEFGGAKIRGPVRLAEITKGAEVLFEFLVQMFGLTIRLGVIGRRHGLGDAEEAT
jgi:hypothetical protein